MLADGQWRLLPRQQVERTLLSLLAPSLPAGIFWEALRGAVRLRPRLVLPPPDWSVSLREGLAREAL